MNTPDTKIFTYKSKGYTLEEMLLHLLRREISRYNRYLRKILFACAPIERVQNNENEYNYEVSLKKISPEKSMAIEINNLKNSFYFNRVSYEQKNRVHAALKNVKNSLYDYLNLSGMYKFYLVIRYIVSFYHINKPAQLDENATEEEIKERREQLYQLYLAGRKEALEQIIPDFAAANIKVDISKTPVVATTNNDALIQAIYKEFDYHYNPAILEKSSSNSPHIREINNLLDRIMEEYLQERNQNDADLLEQIKLYINYFSPLPSHDAEEVTPIFNKDTHEQAEPYYVDGKLLGYLYEDHFEPVEEEYTFEVENEEEEESNDSSKALYLDDDGRLWKGQDCLGEGEPCYDEKGNFLGTFYETEFIPKPESNPRFKKSLDDDL